MGLLTLSNFFQLLLLLAYSPAYCTSYSPAATMAARAALLEPLTTQSRDQDSDSPKHMAARKREKLLPRPPRKRVKGRHVGIFAGCGSIQDLDRPSTSAAQSVKYSGRRRESGGAAGSPARRCRRFSKLLARSHMKI